ncbi:zinc finger RNA-binding protein [Spatholobus suberectus]|nr:zinc finger RNA-binding protein [Spatholobus suberectus]
MNSSGYEQQPQQHGFDLSQSQTPSYDQSSQPCYTQNYPHDDQPQFEQDPTSLPIAPEPPHSAGPSHLNPVQAAPVAGSLNPAAVAVVAGALAQLVGNVDGVPREPIWPSQYRGRGRRGGRPFRGGGRGRFNHHRGRGRGRDGDGRQFLSHSSEPTIANVADVPAADGDTSVMQPSSVSGQSSLPNPAQVPSAPLQSPPCKLWCEICKAECNTPEMLEQHKNGKRHRKNLLVHEEVQRLKALNGQQSGNISNSQSNLTIQPEKIQEFEKKGPEENMGSEATDDNHNDETELQNNVAGVSEVQTEEPQEEPGDNSAIQGHGFKRKMRGGRGGKYMRSDDGSRKPVEPPKSKQVTSFICELCNVKCDSQVVYNSHLTGKKHLSNFKRVLGHQALNGEAGIQPLNPPEINTLSNANNFPVQQGVSVQLGVNDPRSLLAQLLMTVLSNVQVPATAPLSGPLATQIQAPTLVAGSSHEPLSQNLSQTQVSDSFAHFESENPTGETKRWMSSVTLQLDETADSSNNGNTETADGRPAKEETMVKLPQNSSVMTSAENPVAANKQVPS